MSMLQDSSLGLVWVKYFIRAVTAWKQLSQEYANTLEKKCARNINSGHTPYCPCAAARQTAESWNKRAYTVCSSQSGN